MIPADRQPVSASPALAAYLLGSVDFDTCLALQQRLVYETEARGDGHISLLICEHLPAITMGRHGSRLDIRYSPRTLASEGLAIRWVNRGGASLVHAPGQLAIYPIVPLTACGWNVGEFLDRLQHAIVRALSEVGFQGHAPAGQLGLWGRTGQIVALGVAVKNWTTYYGAYVNVSPARRLLSAVQHGTLKPASMSSLAIERRQPVKMSRVREGLVRHLAEAFDCPRYHLHTGHALLAQARTRHGTTARAS
jgi:lipoyl(octanoyl) transferase